MQATYEHHLTHLLRERMEELLFEIVEIQDYLSRAQKHGNQLPLGVMGRVLSTELQNETMNMLEETEQVLCEASSDSWDKNRASMHLNRKIHALVFFLRILQQLPANSKVAHEAVEAMMRRANERCQDIETTLTALAKQNISIPA